MQLDCVHISMLIMQTHAHNNSMYIGRFDLRLPYAEQGWVDEEAEGNKNNSNPFANMFGGGKKKAAPVEEKATEAEDEPKKNGFWPF